MNILLLTLFRIKNINENNLYTDLMREFRDNEHNVYIVTPLERKFKQQTILVENDNVKVLRVKTLNIQKAHFLEKGIATILIESQYENAIKKYFPGIKFDLILYSTPPITFTNIIKSLKKTHHAKSYLLLKDIFPQNAIDLNMMKKNGMIHRFFRRKEKNLYDVSDMIGCMSPANVDYLKYHNESISKKIELCPNSIKVREIENLPLGNKKQIKEKIGIPQDATVFIYGGNLGKPQGLDFLYHILMSNEENENYYFVIIGSGTEYQKIEKWFLENKFKNAKLFSELPKKEYDDLVKIGDVGLIFLDKRFSIPNYPSRLLSYLENKIPVLAATDLNTDIGRIAESNDYGYWCENGNLEEFNKLLNRFASNESLRQTMGENGFRYLRNNYDVSNSYKTIMKHFQES